MHIALDRDALYYVGLFMPVNHRLPVKHADKTEHANNSKYPAPQNTTWDSYLTSNRITTELCKSYCKIQDDIKIFWHGFNKNIEFFCTAATFAYELENCRSF